LPEGAGTHGGRDAGQLSVVEQVEELRAELQGYGFMNLSPLDEGNVPVVDAGSTDDVPPRAAEGSERGRGKRMGAATLERRPTGLESVT
jgi:hypothetical protein